jgi:hypothetical protein
MPATSISWWRRKGSIQPRRRGIGQVWGPLGADLDWVSDLVLGTRGLRVPCCMRMTGVDPDGKAFQPGPGGDAGQGLDGVVREGFLDDELNPRQHEQKSRDERGWLGDGAFGFTQSPRSFEQGGNGHKQFFWGTGAALRRGLTCRACCGRWRGIGWFGWNGASGADYAQGSGAHCRARWTAAGSPAMARR